MYLAKGGVAEDAVGRKCLSNALMANIGHQQVRCGHRVEPPLVTAGDDLAVGARFLPEGGASYGAADVVDALLFGAEEQSAEEEAQRAAAGKL